MGRSSNLFSSVIKQLLLFVVIFGNFLNSASAVERGHETLELMAGLAKPPFIIEENVSGLQLDIIREAFNNENYQVNFHHTPLGRNITGYQQWNSDGIITLPQDYSYPGLFISKPYITYQNVAVTLAERQLTIDSIEDLSGKSVMAFQNARKFLGKTFNDTISYLINYREIADQKKQIEMLFAGRIEVVICDINIFKHFVKDSYNDTFQKEFIIHQIFPKRPYSAGFKNEQIRDAFDRGIELMHNNGSYQYHLDKYLDVNLK